jgi:hypothetical protein
MSTDNRDYNIPRLLPHRNGDEAMKRAISAVNLFLAVNSVGTATSSSLLPIPKYKEYEEPQML